MKKLILVMIVIIGIITNPVFGQQNFGRPYGKYTKHQKKILRSFHSGKRHNRYIPFKKRSYVYDKSVKKDTKKMLRRRYRESIMTKD